MTKRMSDKELRELVYSDNLNYASSLTDQEIREHANTFGVKIEGKVIHVELKLKGK